MHRLTVISISILGLIMALTGCSENPAQRALYTMQQLAYQTGKIAEQINIQPNLATAADSTRLRDAHESIVSYFLEHREDPAITADSAVLHDMGRLALRSQLALARHYSYHRMIDSVLTAYNRIGTVIPAGRDDIAGAALGKALTYRVTRQYDSTIAIYNRILKDYYPPLDYYGRANNDIIAIPVDKIKLAGDNKTSRALYTAEALEYYERLKADYPEYPQLAKTAGVHASRVYAMIENWNDAIDELMALKDSTGQTQIQSLVLIANIYNGPMKKLDKAIDIYRRILSRDPEPDSAIIGQSLLRLGMAMCAQEKYVEGRKKFVEIKNGFTRPDKLLAQTQLYFAQSFNEEGRWERALSEMQWLLESHPYSEEAYRAARMIPEKFKRDGDERLARIWYDRALEFYQRAAVNKQGQMASLAAYSYMADMYQRLERWDEAMETLNKIYSLAPRSQLAAKALYNAASIAYKQLDDSAAAQGYLDKLNTEFGTTDTAELIEQDNAITVESIH